MKKVGYIFNVVIIMMLFANFCQAKIPPEATKGLNDAAVEAGIKPAEGAALDVPSEIGRLVGIALSFVGILFLLLMIYGGFIWMTAAGNEQKVGKAKELIISAIIGMVIIFAAYAITSLIGAELTKPAATTTARINT